MPLVNLLYIGPTYVPTPWESAVTQNCRSISTTRSPAADRSPLTYSKARIEKRRRCEDTEGGEGRGGEGEGRVPCSE
jgi:hypothetical protein